MPMKRLESRIAKDILKDRGAPQGGLNDCELAAGTGMDDVDRSSWPEGAELEAPEAQTEGTAKSASRTNPEKQRGTTGRA